jgi:hypothetical protein
MKIGTWMAGLLLFLSPWFEARAQSLFGTTGLITIPTADLAKDGEVMLGLSVGNKKYNIRNTRFHEYAYFITLGYLPFLEVSLRLHRHYRFEWTDGGTGQGIGDRMASVRLRVLEEGRYAPSVVLGAQDFYSAFGKADKVVYNSSLYAVATKNIRPSVLPIPIGLHLGYGTDRIAVAGHELVRITAKHHDFIGWFGGISMKARPWMTLMAEYDTEKFNGGAALNLLGHVRVLLALEHFDTFAGGLAYSFTL